MRDMQRQLLLLGVLRAQKMHGYQLNDFLERHYDFVTDLKPSTAYYLLDKLAADGYVVMHQEQVGNRPQRRVYEITLKGEGYFLDLLRQNLRGRDKPIYGDEVGLAFLSELAGDEVHSCLDEKLALLGEELENLKNVEAVMRGGANESVYLTLDHHIQLVEADLHWWQQLADRMRA
jgi:DNA-binding PadR family transcriptional regulator